MGGGRYFPRLRSPPDFFYLPLEGFMRLITPEEVRKALGISRRTLFRWVHLGILPPPLRITPKLLRWDQTAIQAALHNLRQSQTPLRRHRKHATFSSKE